MKKNTKSTALTISLFLGLLLMQANGFCQNEIQSEKVTINIFNIETIAARLQLIDALLQHPNLSYQLGNLPGELVVFSKKSTASQTYVQSQLNRLKSKLFLERNAMSKQEMGNSYIEWKEHIGEETYYYAIDDQEIRGFSCDESDPFCTSDIYSFPAGVNSGVAEEGPDYGCLNTQPNPVWYHMKILQAGDITIKIEGTRTNGSALDIDFALWGPYIDPVSPCPDDLTANCTSCPNNTSDPNFYPSGNLHDCSWSGNATEYAHITNGLVDQYYILLITNYANAEGNITFHKEAGSGTGETDCGIVPPPVSNNGPICVHDNLELYADDVTNATYSWTGPAGFTSTQQNPVIYDVGLENAGIYTLVITVDGTSSDPVETIAEINALPSSDFDFSIVCNGESTVFTDLSTIDPPTSAITAWSWDFGDGQQASGQNQTHTYVNAGDFNVTLTTYTGSMQCESSITKTVTVYENPNVNAGDDITIPYGTSTQLNSTIEGGSGFYIIDWQPSEELVVNTVEDPITINLTETTLFTLTVEDENSNCISSDEVTVIIDGEPMSLLITADVNPICAGDPVVIEAVATEGSGNYSYAWTSDPPGANYSTRVITVAPSETTTYFVVVVDGFTTINDQITIIVSPSPVADAGNDISITVGATAQLDGNIGGGSGSYDFIWQPEDLLVDPTIINPTTVQLWDTEVFTLNVTDINSGCANSDNMTVFVSGLTLEATATAFPLEICQGNIVNLNAHPTGGSGVYETHGHQYLLGLTQILKSLLITLRQQQLIQFLFSTG